MFIFFVSAARLLLVFAPIHLPCCWSAHKSLAPRARTLLGGLWHATLSFFAVATLLFVCFWECPKFCDLAKQRRKILGGVSEVGKDDFLLYFFWRCVVFFVSFFFLLASRHKPRHPSQEYLKQRFRSAATSSLADRGVAKSGRITGARSAPVTAQLPPLERVPKAQIVN